MVSERKMPMGEFITKGEHEEFARRKTLECKVKERAGEIIQPS